MSGALDYWNCNRAARFASGVATLISVIIIYGGNNVTDYVLGIHGALTFLFYVKKSTMTRQAPVHTTAVLLMIMRTLWLDITVLSFWALWVPFVV